MPDDAHRLQHGVPAHDVIEEGQHRNSALLVLAEAQKPAGLRVLLCLRPKALQALCSGLQAIEQAFCPGWWAAKCVSVSATDHVGLCPGLHDNTASCTDLCRQPAPVVCRLHVRLFLGPNCPRRSAPACSHCRLSCLHLRPWAAPKRCITET